MQKSPDQAKAFPVNNTRSATSPFYKLDEGFSEAVGSDPSSPGSEYLDIESADDLIQQISLARTWLLSQQAHLRAELASELLGSLPNFMVSDIIRDANRRLRFNPVECLPLEIVLQIFGEFDFGTLLESSRVSTSWRTVALQAPLWRSLFYQVGWTHNRNAVRSFEDNSRSQMEEIRANPRIRPRPADLYSDRDHVKRVRGDILEAGTRAHKRLWVVQSSLQIPTEWTHDVDEPTEDINSSRPAAGQNLAKVVPGRGGADEPQLNPAKAAAGTFEDGSADAVCPLLDPPHIVDAIRASPSLNWHWLYRQRHKLEQNWNANRYTAFRLPHPSFPQEGHKSGIYTLQFSQKHLVSGSRDQTVRVWDLETRRLKYPPLLGHTKSVLCLQFDDKPSRDLIISGGSDSDVIIWKFSTGAIIKKLDQPHKESVLNLQFDDRYLVTCSKDHTIKLWNMRDLLPTDGDYLPMKRTRNAAYPRYILDVQQMLSDPRTMQVDPVPRFSLLMTFSGHGAAVNAIHMQNNFIVSASGDRRLILWNIKDGTLVRQFTGHQKGVACVQFDGRRIISGSSDNTVRVFDSETGAEVATLDSHSHLVRTVQAEFGDILDSEASLQAEARDNDRMIIDSRTPAGSAVHNEAVDPARHFVFGAKLPPGGGGNRWSKIVSGSYDQTVNIWRRQTDGTWSIKSRLRHDDALRLSANPSDYTRVRSQASNPPPPPVVAATQRMERRQQENDLGDVTPILQSAAAAPFPLLGHPTPTLPWSLGLQNNSLGHASVLVDPGSLVSAHGGPSMAQPGSPSQALANATQAATLPAHITPFTQAAPGQPTFARRRLAAGHAGPAEREVPRVFKLQFDARRIISSSSMSIIVGWDFANGDRDIEEASQFFGEPA